MFINERARAYKCKEQEQREKEAENSRRNAITYEEYLRMKEENANKNGVTKECSFFGWQVYVLVIPKP